MFLTTKDLKIQELEKELALKQAELTKRLRPERMTVRLVDQNGMGYAYLAIRPEDVKEATYVATNNTLQLVLATILGRGGSQLKWDEKTNIKIVNNKAVPTPAGGYRQDMYSEFNIEHNLVNITEEDEMRRVWAWLNPDIDIETCFEMRREGLKKMEELKKEKEKELADALEKAKNDPNAKKDQQTSLTVVKDEIKEEGIAPAAEAKNDIIPEGSPEAPKSDEIKE